MANQSMTSPFGWCFIGTGTLAGKVADQLLPSGRHRIVSVYSRNSATSQAFANHVKGTSYTTPEEAISAEGVDAVYIVTPHSNHYEYVKLALELGKPVLCEKAFALNYAQTKELFDLAQEKGLYLAEAMWTWFSPVAQEVKAWVEAGLLGEVQSVTANYHLNSQRYAPRVTDPMAAGGALLDVGVYPITYLYRLFGMPTGIRCIGKVADGVDWSEEVLMRFPSGQQWTASVSIADSKGLEMMELVGSDATISVPFCHSAKAATLKKKGAKSIHFTGDGSYLNEFDCVADEIRAGLTESTYVPPQATLDVMVLLDQCRRQMKLVYPFEGEAVRTVDRSRFTLMTFPFEVDMAKRKITLEEVAALAKGKGLSSVDLMDISTRLIPRYKAALEANGLTVACYISRISLFQPRAALTKALQHELAKAQKLGAEQFMIVPYQLVVDEPRLKAMGRVEVLEQLVKEFRLAVLQAKLFGLKVCFETTPLEVVHLSGAEDCRYVLDRVPELGLAFDTANVLCHGDDPLAAYEALKDRITHVHLKDVALAERPANPFYSERTADGRYMERVLWGDGVVPVAEIYQRLLADGYQGKLALEYACPRVCMTNQRHEVQIDLFMNYLEKTK